MNEISNNISQYLEDFGYQKSNEFIKIISKILNVPIVEYSNKYLDYLEIGLWLARQKKHLAYQKYLNLIKRMQPTNLEYLIKNDRLYLYGDFRYKL